MFTQPTLQTFLSSVSDISYTEQVMVTSRPKLMFLFLFLFGLCITRTESYIALGQYMHIISQNSALPYFDEECTDQEQVTMPHHWYTQTPLHLTRSSSLDKRLYMLIQLLLNFSEVLIGLNNYSSHRSLDQHTLRHWEIITKIFSTLVKL